MLITKSKYVSLIECDKRAWLTVHRPELEAHAEMNPRMAQGIEVGKVARSYFGDFTLVEWGDRESTVARTAELMREGGPSVIAEAAFQLGDTYCVVDILRRSSHGWDVIEVKASTNKTDDDEVHLEDLAFQYYVLTGVGVQVTSASLMRLNGKYERSGDVAVQELFVMTDLTDRVREMQSGVAENIEAIRMAVDSTEEPQVPIGPQCFKPQECVFKEYCWADVPELSPFNYFQTKRAAKEYEAGVRTLSDVLEKSESDKEYLTPRQKIRLERDADPDLEPYVDAAEIEKFLSQISYPVAHLDFETYSDAIPRWDGLRPYQQVTFQYSLHIQERPGGPFEHREFLAPEDEDPRRKLAERLVDDLAAHEGTVVVWNEVFEKGRLEELAASFPDLANELDEINSRIVDLWVPFSKRHYL